MTRGVAIFLVSMSISAISQVLLKKSALIKRESRMSEYLNGYVVFGYAMFFFASLLTILAYRTLPLKYGAVINSLSYLIMLVLGKHFFDEEITSRKLLGSSIIVIGIIVFIT